MITVLCGKLVVAFRAT
nr:hypothetical protein [Vibrio metschnikovii]